MTRWQFATIVVECPIDLPGLVEVDESADVVIAFDEQPFDNLAIDWVDSASSAGTLRRAGFADSLLVMDFDIGGQVRVQLDADKSLMTVSHPNVPLDAAIEHVVADAALPHYLALKGHAVLHASAVEFRGSAVLALGDSGVGKSTLAAALVRAGGRLISDDAVVISDTRNGDLVVHPLARDLRLYGDSIDAHVADRPDTRPVGVYTDKQHVALRPDDYVPRDQPIVLGPAFALDEDEVRPPMPAKPGERVQAIEQAFFGAFGPTHDRRERFKAMTDLAARIRMWHIGIEWTPDGTHRALDEILAVLEYCERSA